MGFPREGARTIEAGGKRLLAAPEAHAASADVMIAEVYGGGGNSGATLTRDFIELGNAAASPHDVTGWSVQYLPGSPSNSSLWQVTPLGGLVPAGGRYLVGESTGAGGTTPLPTPDANGSIPMSATTGTVALVNTTTPLTCKTAADCAADSRIVDLVGYGSAVVRETSPAPAGQRPRPSGGAAQAGQVRSLASGHG